MESYRGKDLPDIYFERLEGVYMEMVSYFDKTCKEHSVGITLNAIHQAYIFVWLASFKGNFEGLEEELEDTVSTFKANVYNVIDIIQHPEDYV